MNILTNTSEISSNTGGDIFQINFPQIDEKKWSRHSHGDFPSIRDTLTCRLSKRVPRRPLLQSCVTKFFIVCNFGNTLAMTIIIFFKMCKTWYGIQIWNRKLRKRFSFLRYLHLNWELQILAILNRRLAIDSQCANKHPYISSHSRGDIFQINFPQNNEKTW